jgi:hypothetical protein
VIITSTPRTFGDKKSKNRKAADLVAVRPEVDDVAFVEVDVLDELVDAVDVVDDRHRHLVVVAERPLGSI